MELNFNGGKEPSKQPRGLVQSCAEYLWERVDTVPKNALWEYLPFSVLFTFFIAAAALLLAFYCSCGLAQPSRDNLVTGMVLRCYLTGYLCSLPDNPCPPKEDVTVVWINDVRSKHLTDAQHVNLWLPSCLLSWMSCRAHSGLWFQMSLCTSALDSFVKSFLNNEIWSRAVVHELFGTGTSGALGVVVVPWEVPPEATSSPKWCSQGQRGHVWCLQPWEHLLWQWFPHFLAPRPTF